MRIRAGQRVFAPSWVMTALTVILCAAFIGLGRWQWERGALRQAQWALFESGAERVLPLGSRALEEIPRFQRVSLHGRYHADRQFLLDNRIHAGRAGYEVLTPLELEDGRVVLVNRGWVPFTGYRDRLPDVSFDPGETREVVGRVDQLPSVGLESGRVAPSPQASWPKLVSFPTLEQLGAAFGRRLEPRIVLLDPDAPEGYVREWQPPGVPPERHWSYAIQWWSFAIVLVILWVVLSMKKVREDA